MQTDPPFDGSVPAPRFVSVETTRYCNLRCRMCLQYHDGTTVSGPHMGIAEFERIAASVFPFVERWQPTVSGEPALARDFDRMLELAEAFGVKAEMYSNGTLFDARVVDRLVPNLASLSVSFDGATKETFEFIRVGADYDEVLAAIRRVVARARALPPALRPRLGVNCTLMERNVRELPALVRLAVGLGLDHVSVNHVFPITAEMRAQSLVHHPELARRCIDESVAVAEATGIVLTIEALDEVIAGTALRGDCERHLGTRDSVLAGFERRVVNADRQRPWPRLDPARPEHRQVLARRAAAAASSAMPTPAQQSGEPLDRGEIWWCEFLWEKAYVAIGGDVRPCCVHGSPVLGNLHEQGFDKLWNGEAWRAMRARLAAREPVPVCRGCLHIRRVQDPAFVERALGGRRPARAAEFGQLPAALDPAQQPPHRTGAPPRLEWPAVAGAREYVLQASLDGFASLLFTTDGLGAPAIREPHYQVPVWVWRAAPVDREVRWRSLARTADGLVPAGAGTIAPEAAVGDGQ